MAKILPSSRDVHEEARVDNLSRYLKRCYVAERQLMRTLAAWFVGTSQWDFKRQLANDMWETSLHADALRTRILELRYPRRDVDKKYDPDVLHLLAECAKAETTSELIGGVYGVLIPALLETYITYLDRTDDLDDAPSVYWLRHIVMDKQTQMERIKALVQKVEPDLWESTQAWQDYLQQTLQSIGGIAGLDEKHSAPTDHPHANRPVYEIPRQVKRDSRLARPPSSISRTKTNTMSKGAKHGDVSKPSING